MRPSRAAQSLRLLAVLAIVAWSIGPVAIGVVTSLSSQTDVEAVPARWIPHTFSTEAYRALITGAHSNIGSTASDASAFGASMLSSVEVTVEATIATLIVSVLAGYAFARLQFRASKAVLWLVLATLVLPLFTLVVALFKLMVQIHLINTQLGLDLVYLSTQAPLAIWLFHNYCRDLPLEPEEAALIDGCTRWQAFRKIVLPQMRSGIAATTAIIVLLVYGQFLIPLLLASSASTTPVTVLITNFVGKYSTDYPLVAAGGVMALIPPTIVALALNRHIRGMLSGSTG